MTNLAATASQKPGNTLHKRAALTILRAIVFGFSRLDLAFRKRHAIEHLKSLDAYLLKDLGIRPGEIEAIVHGRKN